MAPKKRGLYANIAAKKKRIKAGSGEKMRKVGDPGAPTAKNFKQAAKTAKKRSKTDPFFLPRDGPQRGHSWRWWGPSPGNAEETGPARVGAPRVLDSRGVSFQQFSKESN